MKQKVIALLLVAIMTLTAFSAVAVATSQKVEAPKPTSPAPIVLTYNPGAKYVFKPNQFKYDSTWVDEYQSRHALPS